MATEKVETAKFLRLTFSTDGYNKKIKYFDIPNPNDNLTKEQIAAAMNAYLKPGLWSKDGVILTGKKSAEVIERVITTQDFEVEL